MVIQGAWIASPSCRHPLHNRRRRDHRRIEQRSTVLVLVKTGEMIVQDNVDPGDFVPGMHCDHVALQRKVKCRFILVPELGKVEDRGWIERADAGTPGKVLVESLVLYGVGSRGNRQLVVAN